MPRKATPRNPLRKGPLIELQQKWSQKYENMRPSYAAQPQGDTTVEEKIQYAKARIYYECLRDLEKAASLDPVSFYVGINGLERSYR